MGVAAALRRWFADWAAARAFDGLSPDQREALAHDMGVSEDVLNQIVSRGSRAGAELPRLLRTLNLDADRIGWTEPDVLRDLQVTCALCADVKDCRRDLDRGIAGQTFQRYC